jgi:hypothetical protein
MTPPEKPKLFTIAGRCGRLANRILVFAKFAALAEEHGHRLVNFTFHSYSEFFEGTRGNICCRYPRPDRRSWPDIIPGVAAALRRTRILYHVTRYTCLLNERLPIFGSAAVTLRELPGRRTTMLDDPEYQEKIRPARIVFAYGCWLNTPSLVQKHGDKIRAYFRPVEKFAMASGAAIESLRREADVVIGVHIRQGDYRGWQGGNYFFPVARYAAWMRELAAQLRGRTVAFFVCSDEPRSAGEFPGLTVGLGTGSPVSDIYALARCDYIFGTKSTFSQWASFYGEKPLLQISSKDETAKLENFRVSYLDWI